MVIRSGLSPMHAATPEATPPYAVRAVLVAGLALPPVSKPFQFR